MAMAEAEARRRRGLWLGSAVHHYLAALLAVVGLSWSGKPDYNACTPRLIDMIICQVRSQISQPRSKHDL